MEEIDKITSNVKNLTLNEDFSTKEIVGYEEVVNTLKEYLSKN